MRHKRRWVATEPYKRTILGTDYPVHWIQRTPGRPVFDRVCNGLCETTLTYSSVADALACFEVDGCAVERERVGGTFREVS